jgi:hypothetical protein
MLTQRERIVTALTERGWRVVTVVDAPEDWWADEIVELESSWTPVGARLVLTFLVDPQNDRKRRKGDAVWAVAASAVRPSDRPMGGPTLSLGSRWEDRLPAFIAALEQLRVLEQP